MENITIDPLNPQHAYFLGFLYGDGHLFIDKKYPNKGNVTIELKIDDQQLLYEFQKIFPVSSVSFRHRSTNFSDNYDSVIWRMCQQDFRNQLMAFGMPSGKKSFTVQPLTVPHSTIDFWRGLLDADGSIGLTKLGLPFLSLVTVSEPIAKAYEAFLAGITGKPKHTSRNLRDNAYNVGILCEDAVKVISLIYYEGCFGLTRKIVKAAQARAWIRPADMNIVNQRDWTPEEEDLVSRLPLKECVKLLGRNRSSIQNKKFRLRRKNA